MRSEAFQNEIERLAVGRSSFLYFLGGVEDRRPAGLSDNFDEGIFRLYMSIVSSFIPGTNVVTASVKVARADLWHADNTTSNHIAYVGYAAMALLPKLL